MERIIRTWCAVKIPRAVHAARLKAALPGSLSPLTSHDADSRGYCAANANAQRKRTPTLFAKDSKSWLRSTVSPLHLQELEVTPTGNRFDGSHKVAIPVYRDAQLELRVDTTPHHMNCRETLEFLGMPALKCSRKSIRNLIPGELGRRPWR